MARDPAWRLHQPAAARASIYDRKFFPIRCAARRPPSWASAASWRRYIKARLRPIRTRAELRGLGRQPLRPDPLRDLLQDLHREGLGDAHDDISADWAAQRIKGLSLVRRGRHRPSSRGCTGPRRRGDQDAHRPLRVSAARPRPDVGGRPRQDRRAGGVDHDGAASAASTRRRARAVGSSPVDSQGR